MYEKTSRNRTGSALAQALPEIRDLTKDKVVFAQGLGFYKLFWIFLFGCFLGVVIENIWCMATNFYFESRKGLIYGPFNLVYGFGALVLTVLFYRARNRSWLLFFGGTLVGAAYEYLCSFVQEFLFGTVSWQYDQMFLNLNGRVNLIYSLFWGFLCIFWFKLMLPLVDKWVGRIPINIGKPLTWVLLIFMIFNTFISGMALHRMAERRLAEAPSSAFEVFLDRHYPDELLEKVYPNMVFVSQAEDAIPEYTKN